MDYDNHVANIEQQIRDHHPRSHGMKWTHEIPTAEGYYWYRKNRYHGEDRIVFVYGHADYGMMQGKRTVSMASRSGKAQWSDVPIPEPKSNTEQPTP